MRNKKLLFVNLGILFALMVVVIIGVSRMNATTGEDKPTVRKNTLENQSMQISGLTQLSKKVVFSGKEIYKPRNLLARGDNGSFALTSGNIDKETSSTEEDEVDATIETPQYSNSDQSQKQVTFVTNHTSNSSSEPDNSEEETSSTNNGEKDKDTKPNNDSNSDSDENYNEDNDNQGDGGKDQTEDNEQGGEDENTEIPTEPTLPDPDDDSENEEEDKGDETEDQEENTDKEEEDTSDGGVEPKDPETSNKE
ncbi:hypothetical protein [Oceanobacillus iheyensis HTE831]|uniref:Uncharacterized protein n=1 Tax=Oceanobacillus iheyensis (strain DSM 14371 / CIP 107618 / JCM 11309 / KCTC 3954 / HTE831) TaxID=221109 RepID=Q8ERE1_OCEIH|nr:hypothetical protein [Oceanobacillus iheyensis]BAC13320.1 hypothetical protein [Oceanobacillus iheyensis HTE831]